MPVRLESAALLSRVKHSTTEPLRYAHQIYCWHQLHGEVLKTCFSPSSAGPVGRSSGLPSSELSRSKQKTVENILNQGCGNTMPDLPDQVPFHSGQVKKFLFTCPWTSTMYKVNTILYFIFWLIITSSHLALKTMWILISWLLQKPADLDQHCFQEKPADQDPYCLQELIYIWFHTVFERIICLSTERYEAIFFLSDK